MTKQEVAARFDIYKLGENERVESFDCGDADLTDLGQHKQTRILKLADFKAMMLYI